jgi:hypothetical protein
VGLHVDVVRTELANGIATSIARVSVQDGELHVESAHPDAHREMLMRALGADGALLGNGHSDEVLAKLHDRFQGSYIFATEPHEHGGCPYPEDFTRA